MSLARRLWRISEGHTPAWPSLLSSVKSLSFELKLLVRCGRCKGTCTHDAPGAMHSTEHLHRTSACCRFWQKAGSAFRRPEGLDAARKLRKQGARRPAARLPRSVTVIAPAIPARVRNAAGLAEGKRVLLASQQLQGWVRCSV